MYCNYGVTQRPLNKKGLHGGKETVGSDVNGVHLALGKSNNDYLDV